MLVDDDLPKVTRRYHRRWLVRMNSACTPPRTGYTAELRVAVRQSVGPCIGVAGTGFACQQLKCQLLLFRCSSRG